MKLLDKFLDFVAGSKSRWDQNMRKERFRHAKGIGERILSATLRGGT
jgi:hypothetical protein